MSNPFDIVKGPSSDARELLPGVDCVRVFDVSDSCTIKVEGRIEYSLKVACTCAVVQRPAGSTDTIRTHDHRSSRSEWVHHADLGQGVPLGPLSWR